MRAVWLVFAVKLRCHWRSWLLLSLLIAVASGFVLAAAAAARRTDSAFPRYLASHGYDAIVYSIGPLPRLSRLPEVAQVTPIRMPLNGRPRCSCQRRISWRDFTIREVPPAGLRRVVKLVAGRMPDQSSPHEALASFTLQRDYGVRLGTAISLPLPAASQWHAILKSIAGGAFPKPAGPTIVVRVVGIVAAENEFPFGQTAGQSGSYDLYPTRAFAAATRGTPAVWAYYVRLRHGHAGFARFEARASDLNGAGVEDLDGPAAAIISSIHPQAVGWWVLAALAGVAAIAVVGQALARQASGEGTDHPALAALGLGPRQLAALGMLRTLAAAVAGALGGIVVATLLSPLSPVGEARLAEPSPGLSFDAVVTGLGALAIVAAVLLLGLRPALRSARVRGVAGRMLAARPSAVAAAAAAAGAPAVAVIGIRHALERGRGTRALPVGTALSGAAAAVAAVCATVIFGSSLAHLTATPALYGAPFQAAFVTSGPGSISEASLLTELKRDRAIARITLVSAPAIAVNHVSVRAVAATAVRGPMLLSAAQGRLPAGNDEIALGASTMRRIRAHVGSVVRVAVTAPDGTPRTARFRVVGLVPFPGDFATGGLGTGAALTSAGYLGAQCPPTPGQAGCRRAAEARPAGAVLVRAVAGLAGSTALARHIRRHHDNASPPTVPEALVNFGEAAYFPLLLGGVVAVCGLATLAHLLVVSMAGRRTERWLLLALGMVRRQLATIVFWQATTVAVVAIAAGVPVGIAAGQAVWRAFAVSIGVVPVPVVQGWLIAALAAGALLTSNALATVPAVAAARSRPGHLLRTE